MLSLVLGHRWSDVNEKRDRRRLVLIVVGFGCQLHRRSCKSHVPRLVGGSKESTRARPPRHCTKVLRHLVASRDSSVLLGKSCDQS